MALKKVNLTMSLDLLQRIDKVAKRVNITRDQVIGVILAIELEKVKDQNGHQNETANKKRNAKSSANSRLAKRSRSR